MMLRRFVILLGLTAAAYAGLPPGRPLPDVPISESGGKKLDLKQYRGKALVLMLMATTCAHCTEVLNLLKQIQTEQAAHGLQVVAAAGDDNAAAVIGRYAAAQKPNFPLGFVDRPALRKLANLGPKDRPFVPIMLFVDPKGSVRVQLFGNDPLMTTPEPIIRSTVRELLKEPGIAAANGK
jgi:thiol-disulfide isomerase/thioredoxin